MNATHQLNPLSEVLPFRSGVCYCTMNADQWGELLQGAYDAGWTLLVLDDQERPLRAFRKAVVCG
jgi:hypothetical protein